LSAKAVNVALWVQVRGAGARKVVEIRRGEKNGSGREWVRRRR
jgi:hypothetical protein